jgi:methyltransferase-like protein/cyclopropane fatty-acyl-phospholipid synthase-like methyltransferase
VNSTDPVPSGPSTSYDDIPYESHPFAQTHPNRLSTIAALFGLKTANLNQCRVLELGCCSGGNLIPIAEQYPQSQFLGIDASSRQIRQGQAILAELSIPNLELRHQDILEFGADQGQFDYIITHGVYSWAPRAVQDKILQICKDHLAPSGVAYISYNTYPGWRLRGTIRDIMSYRARGFATPHEKLREARALLDFLASAVPSENNAYGMMLSKELAHLQPKQDWYLIHEYLEEFNEPEYFHQFMHRAQQFDLQYMGEADYSTMLASNFPAEVQQKLQQLGGDIIETEQYMDLVRNRLFRQTILCKSDIKLDRRVGAERIQGMCIATNSKPKDATASPDIHSREPVTFMRPGSTLTTKEPLVKAAIQCLRDVWPRALPFEELLAAARGKLQPGLEFIDSERVIAESRNLALPLLRCYATTHIDLHAQPPNVDFQVSERPQATQFSRWQAKSGSVVTNLWHETVRLSDIERRVLMLLNGERQPLQIQQSIEESVLKGTISLQAQGKSLSDPGKIRATLEAAIPQVLGELCRKGLLLH